MRPREYNIQEKQRFSAPGNITYPREYNMHTSTNTHTHTHTHSQNTTHRNTTYRNTTHRNITYRKYFDFPPQGIQYTGKAALFAPGEYNIQEIP